MADAAEMTRIPRVASGVAAAFLLSTFVAGPALTGDDSDGAKPSATPAERPAAPSAHEQHH